VVALEGGVDLGRLVDADDLDPHADRLGLLLQQLGLGQRRLGLRRRVGERQRPAGLLLVLLDEALGLLGVVGREAGVLQVPDVAGGERRAGWLVYAGAEDGVALVVVEGVVRGPGGLVDVERRLR